MLFHFSFYSSILLIFFSQGICFSFLLWKKGLKFSSEPSKWLSFFVLLCSLYLLPWMCGFAGWYSQQPYRDIMFYCPFQQLFLIGPVIYFYTRSLLNPSFTFQRKHGLHLLPALAYLAYRLIVFVVDKLILHQYYFYADGRDKNLATWYQVAGWLSMFFYFFLCFRYYSLYQKIIFQTVSFADRVLFNWIKKYLLAFLFMQLLWLIFFLFFPHWGSFKEKWWYYVAFSSLLYYIGITGYADNIKSLIPFSTSSPENNTVYLLGATVQTTSTEKEVPELIELEAISDTEITPQAAAWKEKIMNLIETEKLYQNPNLTLLDIAQKLQTNQTLISKMMNQGFRMNFNDCINEYRVKAVIDLLQKGEQQRQTLLGIAMDGGFNSKTTFNRCFKKYTGMSPKVFIENLNKQASSSTNDEIP